MTTHPPGTTRRARVTWSHVMPRPLIVLLGRKVQAATEGPEPFEHFTRGPSVLLGLPHPSGLNRLWHQPDARRRARAAFEALRAGLEEPSTETAAATGATRPKETADVLRR